MQVQGSRFYIKVVAWIAKCIAKENDKITTAADLYQDAKKRRKNTSDSTGSSKRQRKRVVV